jgi:hypothetical protein
MTSSQLWDFSTPNNDNFLVLRFFFDFFLYTDGVC